MQASELATKLGVHLTTLRTWERTLGVQVPRDRLGNRVYEEAVVSLFEQVAQLRQEEKALDQIREDLKEDIAAFSGETRGDGEISGGDASIETRASVGQFSTEIHPELLGRFLDTTKHLADQMTSMALHNQKLLEEIKNAYHQVGTLQEREKNLQLSLDWKERILSEKTEEIQRKDEIITELKLLMPPKISIEEPKDLALTTREAPEDSRDTRLTWWERLFKIRRLREGVAQN